MVPYLIQFSFNDPQNLFGSNRRQVFSESFRCYSVAMLPGTARDNVSYGGKVIMPPSALAKLASLHIEYPMLFELVNQAQGRHTHAGVLEFIAPEGRIYLPLWVPNLI